MLERAKELGASAVRVARADDQPAARERMRAAFARGDFEQWPYDARYAAGASSAASLLPGAKSVVCVALPYATPRPPARPPGSGLVSNYAWSVDYHHALRRMLRELADVIDACAGAPVTRIACDTAPLAERAYAERAGLGWIGKHTNAIVPASGSFVFLGEIVSTVALPEDPPLRKSCGSCARCVAACPTGALRGDYTLDANRCISDLTQRKGPLPRAMRPLVGDWVWGCDLCQEACPPTRRATPRVDRAFAAPDAARAFPDLQGLLAMRRGEFKRRFATTAMGWRGAAVLRRNAAVALGNGLDRATVPALERALEHDPSALVRGHAAWALGRIASPGALAALRSAAGAEADASVREEIAAALEPSTAPQR